MKNIKKIIAGVSCMAMLGSSFSAQALASDKILTESTSLIDYSQYNADNSDNLMSLYAYQDWKGFVITMSSGEETPTAESLGLDSLGIDIDVSQYQRSDDAIANEYYISLQTPYNYTANDYLISSDSLDELAENSEKIIDILNSNNSISKIRDSYSKTLTSFKYDVDDGLNDILIVTDADTAIDSSMFPDISISNIEQISMNSSDYDGQDVIGWGIYIDNSNGLEDAYNAADIIKNSSVNGIIDVSVQASSVPDIGGSEYSPTFGDVNSDEKVSISDAIALNRYIINVKKLDHIQYVQADYNEDGAIDVNDSMEILRKIVISSEQW